LSVPEDAVGRSVAGPQDILSLRDFGWQLTLVRERAGLTVREVAKAVGLPSSTVGGYFGGSHLPPVRSPKLLPDILAVCRVTDPVVVAQWTDALTRVRHAASARRGESVAPYRGLASFQPEHADWFFGREDLTESLIRRLARPAAARLPAIVVGPSGSGKSSLLRAGLIPAVQAGRMDVADCAHWQTLLFVPGEQPLTELSKQLGALAGLTPGEVVRMLEPGQGAQRGLMLQQAAQSLAQAAGATAAQGPREWRLVVAVDQFEETFTAVADAADREAFVSALGAVAETAVVVLAMRADFYPQALRYPLLAAALQDAQLVVRPMAQEELRRAIVEPARKANLDVADGLVEVLLREFAPLAQRGAADAAHDIGALPLLSHALLATWKASRRGELTLADYQGTGGVSGAVAHTAERAFDDLTDAQRDLARRLFLRLVHIADDAADTRRRVTVGELFPGDNRADGSELGLVLDTFIDRRLITADAETVEIAHEALLSAWPRLREWIENDRAGLRLHRQLTEAARTWESNHRDPLALYRGNRLYAAREWADDPAHTQDLNALEREFLDRSTGQELADTRATRRRTRRLQQLVGALTVLFVVSGLLSGFAFHERAAATGQRNLAISRQVAIEADQLRSTDASLAMQLSLAAYRISPTPEARSSVLDSYAGPAETRIIGPAGVMQAIAVSPDGRTLAGAGTSATVQLWNLAHPGRPSRWGPALTGHTNTIYSVAYSPDGRVLASAGGDKTVRLWDVADPARARALGTPLAGPANTVYSVAFSPNGRLLAAGSADDRVWLWDVSNPGRPRRLDAPLSGPAGYVQSVAFSPDGHTLAAGGADDAVHLWDFTDPHRPVPLGAPLTGAGSRIYTVAFSPDGRTLAAGSADKTVRLWNTTDPRRPVALAVPLVGPASWVNSVAFSPDGRFLAAGSSDDKLWVWDLSTDQVTASLPHPAPVTAVQFFHNGASVAIGGADGTARIWDLPGPVMTGPTQSIFAVAFGVGGAGEHMLAVAGADNTAQLWNVSDPRDPVRVGPTLVNATREGRPTGAAALSPDTRTLAVGALDGSVQLWDLSDRLRPRPIPTRLTGLTGLVQSITFSPDGRILAAGGNDHRTALWDVSTPARPVPLGQPLTGPTNYVYSPSISPDGRVLAVGGADDRIWLWDIADPARPRRLGPPLTGPASYVNAVAFSPDGRTLAAGSADSRVWLWDMTDPARPRRLDPPLAGPTSYVYSVAFSADGRDLAASTGDGSIWLWDVGDLRRPQLLATLTGPKGAVFTDVFDPDHPVLATAGADGTVRLWNTDTDQVAGFICAASGDPMTASEWAQYIPGLPYNPPCRNT
jgi:WD40 repeat protein/transcriptional regulator with XRE-family HTH domain